MGPHITQDVVVQIRALVRHRRVEEEGRLDPVPRVPSPPRGGRGHQIHTARGQIRPTRGRHREEGGGGTPEEENKVGSGLDPLVVFGGAAIGRKEEGARRRRREEGALGVASSSSPVGAAGSRPPGRTALCRQEEGQILLP